MFKRLGNLIKAFFNKLLGKAESMSPEMLIEQTKEDMRKSEAKFNSELASLAGSVETLRDKDETEDSEYEQLKQKALLLATQGKKDLATKVAQQMAANREKNKVTERQFEEAESQYETLIEARNAALKEARSNIEEIERNVDEANRDEALAEMNEMANNMTTSIGSAGDTLARLKKQTQERKEKARGRAKVAKSSYKLNKDPEGIDEALEEASGELFLASLLAQEGIGMPEDLQDTKEKSSSSKTMGPTGSYSDLENSNNSGATGTTSSSVSGSGYSQSSSDDSTSYSSSSSDSSFD